MTPVLQIANRALIRPLLSQDGVAVEAEQVGYDEHFGAPITEFNPAVHLFQDLTIRKWEEYLAEKNAAGDWKPLRVHEKSWIRPPIAREKAEPQPAGV